MLSCQAVWCLSLLWGVTGGREAWGQGWGDGVLSPLPPLSGVQLQPSLAPMGGWEGAGSPSGLQGQVQGSPRTGFPDGEGGGGSVYWVHGRGSPFLFYTINILHQRLLPLITLYLGLGVQKASVYEFLEDSELGTLPPRKRGCHHPRHQVKTGQVPGIPSGAGRCSAALRSGRHTGVCWLHCPAAPHNTPYLLCLFLF